MVPWFGLLHYEGQGLGPEIGSRKVKRISQATDDSDAFRPYPAWWWGAIAGLTIGWFIGLVVKASHDALLSMTLDLVPESAVVVEAHASGDEFEYPFDAGPPFASADITSPLPPKELADQLDVVARGRGWDLLPVEYWPNAIRRPLRSLFYEARVSTRLLPQDSGATAVDISVRRHEWTGPAIVAATSLLIAAVGGFLSERRRRDKTPQHLPWSLWLSTIFVAAIWVAALSFVR